MSSTHSSATPYYFVPGESRHPVMAAIGLFFVILGAGQWINGHDWGKYSLAFGLGWWLTVLYQWFGDAIRESEGGLYGHKIDLSYRWSMSWFIFSEVMFFGAFFTALWWARAHSVPALGSLENALLWPDFKAVWPSLQAGATASPAGIVEPFQTVGPFWLPTINTALLLTSGVTLTIAHHALRENRSKPRLFPNRLRGCQCVGPNHQNSRQSAPSVQNTSEPADRVFLPQRRCPHSDDLRIFRSQAVIGQFALPPIFCMLGSLRLNHWLL